MNARKIAVAGALGAVAILLGATPLGFIPWFSGASITIMTSPVVIGAVIEGPVVGLVVGFLFGGFSFLHAAGLFGPVGPTDALFLNPLVSVLPRLLIGPIAWLVYRAIERLGVPVALVLAGIGGSLTNTVLVLGVIGLFKLASWAVLGGIAIVNGLPEAAANAILVLAVVAAWKRIEYGRRRGARLE